MDDINWQRDHGTVRDRIRESVESCHECGAAWDRSVFKQCPECFHRESIHEQPDDEFTRDAARLGARITDPLRQAEDAIAHWRALGAVPAMAEASTQIDIAFHAIAQLVELYATLSRGTVRERRARVIAEHKLYEIRKTLDA